MTSQFHTRFARQTTCLRMLALFCLLIFLPSQGLEAQVEVKKEVLPDGVVHWYVPELPNGKSYFVQKFEEAYSVVFPPKDAPPFGKSFAILVGVSRYKYLTPQLPSVQNDIDAMKNFLLYKAGFDEVYVVADEAANRDLIEQYVKAVLPARMQKNDRLIFYYSGHGGDNQGNTGYLLFGNAKKDQFYGNDVLEISSIKNWGDELRMPHLLIILDSCASGLAIASKSGSSDSGRMLLQTLSGNGSRIILTAGTAAEKTYAEEGRAKTGNSFFTKALLDAFESRSLYDQKSGFITINDLFADVEKEMASFRVTYGKSTTPRMWPFKESDYRGTFVFLNPRATSAHLTNEQAQALGIKIAAKGAGDEANAVVNAGMGTIEVRPKKSGNLFIDDVDMGYVEKDKTGQFPMQPSGPHKVRIDDGVVTEVVLFNGDVAHLNIGYANPVDASPQAPTGTVVIHSKRKEPGEVFVDGYLVGKIEKDGDYSFPHIVEGPHEIRTKFAHAIANEFDYVTRGQTTDVKIPAPPMDLKATVQ
jgi:Caspase domain